MSYTKEVKLSHGVKITESEDMGIFIHYKSISGNDTGMFLGNDEDTPGHLWARELLDRDGIEVSDE